MKITAWQLFNRNFKVGDEVIVVDDDDRVRCGKLKSITERGCYLVHGNRYTYVYWSDTRFMAHDGFPVRKLMGADGHTTIESEPTAKRVVRAGLIREFGHLVFGDPFLVEQVSGFLHNPGNEGLEFDCEDGEECLDMVAHDGARGMLWHLPTVFYASA